MKFSDRIFIQASGTIYLRALAIAVRDRGNITGAHIDWVLSQSYEDLVEYVLEDDIKKWTK